MADWMVATMAMQLDNEKVDKTALTTVVLMDNEMADR